MGVNFCLATLSSSLLQLKKLDKIARKLESIELQQAVDEIINNATDVVFPAIKKLQAIYSGEPLVFIPNDHLSPADIKKAITAFKKDSLGRSGLRYHIDDEDATDRQFLDTFFAIDAQPFSQFEVLTHHAVMGIEAEVKDLAEKVVLEEVGAEEVVE